MKKQEKKDRKKERQMVNIAYLRDVEQPIGRNLVKKKKWFEPQQITKNGRQWNCGNDKDGEQ